MVLLLNGLAAGAHLSFAPLQVGAGGGQLGLLPAGLLVERFQRLSLLPAGGGDLLAALLPLGALGRHLVRPLLQAALARLHDAQPLANLR